MQTTPVVNLVQRDRAVWATYSDWMRRAHQRGDTAVQTAKRVLGPQDYCWLGSRRNWIWEREFTAILRLGRAEPWHWRLFASTRGFTLEIEDKYGRPNGDSIRLAGFAGLKHFIKTWEESA